ASSPMTSKRSKILRITYSSSTCSSKNHFKNEKVVKSFSSIHLADISLNCWVTKISCSRACSNTPLKESNSVGILITSGEIALPPRSLIKRNSLSMCSRSSSDCLAKNSAALSNPFSSHQDDIAKYKDDAYASTLTCSFNIFSISSDKEDFNFNKSFIS